MPNELHLIKLLSDLLAEHCNLPPRFWWFFSSLDFNFNLEMGIPHKERSSRGGPPTGDQEIPAKAQKKVIGLQLSITSANQAQPGYATAVRILYYLTKRAKSLAGNLGKKEKYQCKVQTLS